MSNKIVEFPVADLVEDMDYYPRHSVDSKNLQSIADALLTGVELPPIIADTKSKRIVDGWHRCRAYLRVYGAEAKAPVQFVAYRDVAEMKIDAVTRNSHHGKGLEGIDRVRSVHLLESSGVSVEKIAIALSVSPTRVEKLRVRVTEGPKNSPHNIPGTSKIVLKNSVAHLQGQKLSKKQADALPLMPGTSFLLLAKQLLVGLKEGLVNLQDERLVQELIQLRDALAVLD